MRALIAAALVGIVHVHHAPSHDSDRPFSEVLEGAFQAGLDFVVLTDHVEPDARGPLPAAEHAGLYARPGGGELLVLVGAELSTRAGHLLALAVPALVPARDRPAREVIGEIHAAGGFAVVPHPFTHGGWQDWDAPFDGLEVHNNASDLRRFLGPCLPFHLLHFAFDREAVLRKVLVRPARELERWEELLRAGRRVVAFSGADAHRNTGFLGWALDPYEQQFRLVQMHCPEGPLTPAHVWASLRAGNCVVRYRIYEARAAEAREVRFPSGHVELELDGGARVLEVRNPTFANRAPYTEPSP